MESIRTEITRSENCVHTYALQGGGQGGWRSMHRTRPTQYPPVCEGGHWLFQAQNRRENKSLTWPARITPGRVPASDTTRRIALALPRNLCWAYIQSPRRPGQSRRTSAAHRRAVPAVSIRAVFPSSPAISSISSRRADRLRMPEVINVIATAVLDRARRCRRRCHHVGVIAAGLPSPNIGTASPWSINRVNLAMARSGRLRGPYAVKNRRPVTGNPWM